MQQKTAAIGAKSRSRLVRHLESLVTSQDLGALALLRRGLGRQPGEVPEIYAQVLPYLASDSAASPTWREREENAALLMAPLYALWHQGKAQTGSAEGVSLGAAFRRLGEQQDSDSIEQRFVALLKASHDRLPDHLRHAIALLKAKEIALDWDVLFRDIYRWDEPNRRVRHRWARDYWERARETETDAGGSGGDTGGEDDGD